MTCIIGLKDNGKVYMGADSAAGDSGQLTINKIANPKIFKKGEFIIGYTTSFRMGQLLEHYLDVPKNKGKSDYEYMVKVVTEEVRKIFNEYGYGKKDNNKEWGGTFLIAYRNNLYIIQNDYAVLQYSHNYCAIGCGEYYAMGALYATCGFPPELRLSQALKAASEFSMGVCEPFVFLESDD